MLFPYGTERELERVPVATWALIAANCFVYGLQVLLGWQGMENPLALDPTQFHLWQPLTSMFAHANIVHITTNMVFLWVFGSHAEDVLGIGHYLVVYFVAGISAAFLHVCIQGLTVDHELVGMLGASGAIMGILALFVLRFPRVRVLIFYIYFIYVGTWLVQARWVALFYIGSDVILGIVQVVTGSVGGVAHWAHLGGFAAGAAVAYKLRLPEAAASDGVREEIGKLASSGAYELAAARAIEEAEKAPGEAAAQELAAVHCGATAKFANRVAEYWLRALRLHIAAQQYEGALRCYGKLVSVYGTAQVPPPVRIALAEAQVCLRNPGGAISILRTVLEEKTSASMRAEAAFRAGEIAAMHLQVRELARQYFSYVVRYCPDSRQALEAEDWLRRLGVS